MYIRMLAFRCATRCRASQYFIVVKETCYRVSTVVDNGGDVVADDGKNDHDDDAIIVVTVDDDDDDDDIVAEDDDDNDDYAVDTDEEFQGSRYNENFSTKFIIWFRDP